MPFWNGDLQQHHGFEQNRLRFLDGIPGREEAGDPEGRICRVHVVIRAINELDLHAVDGIARHEASREALSDACLDRLMNFGGMGYRLCSSERHSPYHAARQAGEFHMRILAVPTRVPELASSRLRRPRQRLAISDLRAAHARLDVELALQAVDDDFEMQLSRAAQDNLAGLLIDLDADCRVLGRQLLERPSKPLPSSSGVFGLIGMDSRPVS